MKHTFLWEKFKKCFRDFEIFWKEGEIWNRGKCINGLGGWTPLRLYYMQHRFSGQRGFSGFATWKCSHNFPGGLGDIHLWRPHGGGGGIRFRWTRVDVWSQAPCGRPHRKLKSESTDVILSSSHATKLASFFKSFILTWRCQRRHLAKPDATTHTQTLTIWRSQMQPHKHWPWPQIWP